jgi:hypothetical protein
MRKPKNQTLIKLRPSQPDCCADCPLVGLVPSYVKKPKGSKETHVCMATFEALTGRGIKIRASQRDSTHPLHRPCDNYWEKWVQLPGSYLPVPDELYLNSRLPYERTQQLRIKFHTYKKSEE